MPRPKRQLVCLTPPRETALAVVTRKSASTPRKLAKSPRRLSAGAVRNACTIWRRSFQSRTVRGIVTASCASVCPRGPTIGFHSANGLQENCGHDRRQRLDVHTHAPAAQSRWTGDVSSEGCDKEHNHAKNGKGRVVYPRPRQFRLRVASTKKIFQVPEKRAGGVVCLHAVFTFHPAELR